jgi:hypothetical protein
MDNPKIIVPINCNAGDLPNLPIIWQWLGPKRVNGVARAALHTLDALGALWALRTGSHQRDQHQGA